MSSKAMARREKCSCKLTVLWAGISEIIFGAASLAMALVARQQYHQIIVARQQYHQMIVQGTTIITLLSGVFVVALHRATSAAAYYISALAGIVSTIVGLVGVFMGMKYYCSTPFGLYMAIVVTMTFGTVASVVHMSYAIVVLESHLCIHDQVRAARPGLESVEVDRFPAGWCLIVDWLRKHAVINGAQTRIKIMPHDDESKIDRKSGADEATNSSDLIPDVEAIPDPPRYDEITEPQCVISEKI